MRVTIGDKVFAYRVAGVATHDDKILIHKAETDPFWALPGGTCEFNEDSQSALKREMKEELNANIEVGRLLWVVENFFEQNGKPWHEIGLYYQMHFIKDSVSFYEKEEFYGVESFYKENQDIRLIFRWMPMPQIGSEDVRPKFLKSHLTKIPEQTEVILNRG